MCSLFSFSVLWLGVPDTVVRSILVWEAEKWFEVYRVQSALPTSLQFSLACATDQSEIGSLHVVEGQETGLKGSSPFK